MSAHGRPVRTWPVELSEGRVGLRPIKTSDRAAWQDVNNRNRAWLRPWEATVPPSAVPHTRRPSFRQMVRQLRHEGREGRMLPFVVTLDGRLVGQLTVAGITWGSMCSAHIGYWIDREAAGRGVMPTAVALAADHCLFAMGLHRVEVCIRPENRPSRRVAEKLGFREEGLRPRYLHIDGEWRDHLVFALTAEEVPGGLLARWRTEGLRGRRAGDRPASSSSSSASPSDSVSSPDPEFRSIPDNSNGRSI